MKTTTAIRSASQLAEAIRHYRKALGLSQSALAERSGVPQVTISMIESGARNPSLPTVLSIFAALDVQLTISPRKSGPVR